jgi:hypothetical protein
VIAALEGQKQTRFEDINTRVDDLTTKLEALGLHANMNRGRREARIGDDACCQLVIERVHANPRGQYDYGYSYDEEYLFWLIGSINKNFKEERNAFGDLTRGQPYFRPIPKILSTQPLVYVKGVGEDKLNEDHVTLSNQDKQPQPKRHKLINVIKGQ